MALLDQQCSTEYSLVRTSVQVIYEKRITWPSHPSTKVTYSTPLVQCTVNQLSLQHIQGSRASLEVKAAPDTHTLKKSLKCFKIEGLKNFQI